MTVQEGVLHGWDPLEEREIDGQNDESLRREIEGPGGLWAKRSLNKL